MELGQYQMQIVLSLVVILGAAFVALVCDLLKGNNEQLRELAIELKIRREEESKRFQMLAPHAMAAPAAAAALASGPSMAIPSSAKSAQQIERPVAAGQPLAAPVTKRLERRDKRPLAPDALAAIQRGVQLAAGPRPRRVPSERPTVSQPAAKVSMVEAMRTEASLAEVMTPTAASSFTTTSSGASRDWGSLLNARRNPIELTRMNTAVAATASTASAPAGAEPALPAGFQDGFVLTRLVEARQPVSGLVVSIGASTSQDTNRSLPADVRGLIQSLIGPNDFAAQSGKDEFLLIYPGERGASAQRRLSQIAEQLWDFQLRSMGALSILFSWGGVEVRSETIDEAIASATERMQETRRGRSRVLTMEPRAENAPLRRAV